MVFYYPVFLFYLTCRSPVYLYLLACIFLPVATWLYVKVEGGSGEGRGDGLCNSLPSVVSLLFILLRWLLLCVFLSSFPKLVWYASLPLCLCVGRKRATPPVSLFASYDCVVWFCFSLFSLTVCTGLTLWYVTWLSYPRSPLSFLTSHSRQVYLVKERAGIILHLAARMST